MTYRHIGRQKGTYKQKTETDRPIQTHRRAGRYRHTGRQADTDIHAAR